MPERSTGTTAAPDAAAVEEHEGAPPAVGEAAGGPGDATTAGGRGAEPAKPRRWDLRWELFAFLELLAACGFAVTQPLLDVTGRSADFFMFSSAEPIDIILMLVAATLPIPVALWALGAIVGIAGGRTRRAAHVVLVGAVLAVVMIIVGRRLTPLRGLPLGAAAVAAGAGLAVAYARTQFLRQMLRLASIGPALFVGLFVFASPSGAILRHGDAGPVAAEASVTSSVHPPIVVVLFDEFSLRSMMDGNGHVDAKRYPNFAALAGESTWYRNATAVNAYTPYAVSSMLQGRYPYKQAAPHYLEYPENLFTLFDGVYDMQVQESVSRLCPKTTCDATTDVEPKGGSSRAVLKGARNVLRDIVSLQDSTADPTAGFEEPTGAAEEAGESPNDQRRTKIQTGFGFGNIKENQPSRLTDFVNGLKPSASPTVHFLHVLLPHTPYRHLPSGTRYDPAPNTLAAAFGPGAKVDDATARWWQDSLRERYDAQLAYTDALVGEMVRTMKESGLWDKALVILTADHGVTFTPGFYKRDYKGSAADILWVPLFIKAPGQAEGRIDDRNFEHADLFPTIADYAGIQVPWRMDGVSARGPARERQDKWYYPAPGAQITVPQAPSFAEVLRGWAPRARPVDELVGKRVADFQVTDTGQVATVEGLARFDDVDPATGNAPAYLYGRLPAEVNEGQGLAIAVNGRIAAVAPTARNGEQLLFAGLIKDDSVFVAGRNQLELFVVHSHGRSLRRLGAAELD